MGNLERNCQIRSGQCGLFLGELLNVPPLVSFCHSPSYSFLHKFGQLIILGLGRCYAVLLLDYTAWIVDWIDVTLTYIERIIETRKPKPFDKRVSPQ